MPTAWQLRDGATVGNFAWIGLSVTYFFLLTHPVFHANFLGHVSVCRSCLGCILWPAVPSAISSSPGFRAPPALLSPCLSLSSRLSCWGLAGFGTADLGMVCRPHHEPIPAHGASACLLLTRSGHLAGAGGHCLRMADRSPSPKSLQQLPAPEGILLPCV